MTAPDCMVNAPDFRRLGPWFVFVPLMVSSRAPDARTTSPPSTFKNVSPVKFLKAMSFKVSVPPVRMSKPAVLSMEAISTAALAPRNVTGDVIVMRFLKERSVRL